LPDRVRGRTVEGAMSEPDSDQVRADDSKIPPAPPAPTQVCIISSDPLRAFIGALSPALRAREEFTIIVDRRRAGLDNVAVRPAIERRHHPSIDTKVHRDGFAIVSLSTTDALPWIEHVVDHQPAYDDADAEVDWRECGRIVESQHRRKAGIGPLVRISAIAGAFSVLVVLFVQMTAGTSLMNRAQPVALPTWEGTPGPSIEAQAASVTEVPVPPRPARPLATALEPARPAASNAPPSVRLGSLSASALDPTRPSEGSFPRRADTASTPGEAAPLSSAPRQPSTPRRQSNARGLEAGIEALTSRVTTDMNMAAVEAKGQFDDLQSKTMKNLAEMRRMWNNAAQVFSDKPLVSKNSPH